MDNDTVIWIVVAAIVLLALLALLAVLMRKRKEKQLATQRLEAQQLRHQATSTTPNVTEAQLRAEEAEGAAQLKRAEAERAQQRAAEEQQRLAAEEARREDLVREADRLDPDVDTRTGDYSPRLDEPPSGGTSGGTHRA